jgi:hypothetical protein
MPVKIIVNASKNKDKTCRRDYLETVKIIIKKTRIAKYPKAIL